MARSIMAIWARISGRLWLSTREAIFLGLMAGLPLGVGGHTLVYAHAASYVSNDPTVCANCHIMAAEYDGWLKSSHQGVAVCNDCHTPGDPLGKYLAKASNGFHHSYAFTTQDFEYPIQIKPHNREVAEHACRKCHSALIMTIDTVHGGDDALECLRCHSSVGHLR